MFMSLYSKGWSCIGIWIDAVEQSGQKAESTEGSDPPKYIIAK